MFSVKSCFFLATLYLSIYMFAYAQDAMTQGGMAAEDDKSFIQEMVDLPGAATSGILGAVGDGLEGVGEFVDPDTK